MAVRTPIALAAAAGVAGVVSAQTPSFYYSIQGPSFTNPGETYTTTVLCWFTPGVGGTVSTPVGPRPVLGLSSGSFNIVAHAGSWSNLTLLPPYNAVGTSPGSINGSSIAGVNWGNGFPPPIGTVSTVNPTPLWQGTFTAPSFGWWGMITLDPVGNHGVWAGNPGEIGVESVSQATQGAAVTQHPAPAAFSVLVLAAVLSRRRSRPVGHTRAFVAGFP